MAKGVPVRSLFFPANQPRSGPGFSAAGNLRPYRSGRQTHRITYFPSQQLFLIEELGHPDNAGNQAVKSYGMMGLDKVEWWEPMENPTNE